MLDFEVDFDPFSILQMIIAQSKEASTSRAIRDHGLGGGVVAPIDNGMCVLRSKSSKNCVEK